MKTLSIIALLFSVSGGAFAGVTIYTQPNCEPCEQAKQYFKDNKIKYKECSVLNAACLKQFNALGSSGTPLIMINGKRIDGFSKKKIDEALGI